MEEEFYQDDIKAVDKELHLIEEWNRQELIDRTVRLNIPNIWTFMEGSSRAGQKVLQEPFIQ